MSVVVDIIRIGLLLFFVLLLARLVVSFISFFSERWRPRGATLFLVEGVLSATDPPVRAVRKILPEINLGNVRMDLSIMVLIILVTLAMGALSTAP